MTGGLGGGLGGGLDEPFQVNLDWGSNERDGDQDDEEEGVAVGEEESAELYGLHSTQRSLDFGESGFDLSRTRTIDSSLMLEEGSSGACTGGVKSTFALSRTISIDSF